MMSENRFHSCADGMTANALAGKDGARDLERRYGGLVADYDALDRMESVAHTLSTSATNRIGQTCTFFILKSERLGAFSVSSGRIYITQGLYDYLDEDELLAAVIAHEMAHVWARDGERAVPKNAERRLLREKAADRYAAQLLFRAGWSPSAIIEVLEITRAVQPPGYCDARIAELRGVNE